MGLAIRRTPSELTIGCLYFPVNGIALLGWTKCLLLGTLYNGLGVTGLRGTINSNTPLYNNGTKGLITCLQRVNRRVRILFLCGLNGQGLYLVLYGTRVVFGTRYLL